MDKLRAIEYFNRTVKCGSFSAAARELDVSTPAVTMLVSALEKSLGQLLLHRTRKGVALTANGKRFYDGSHVLLAKLADLEQRVSSRTGRPRGTLTVGLSQPIGQYCLMPRIPEFLGAYPEIDLALRQATTVRDIDAQRLDLALLGGWPDERDVVVRPLYQTRNVVCAAPEYWVRAGRPSRPADLGAHTALVFRSTGGAVLDRWTFSRDDERVSVVMKSRILSDDSTWQRIAACAGAGVVRAIDVTVSEHITSGALVPALNDWTAEEAPLIFAAWRPGQRQSRLVRAFLDFAIGVFRDLEAQREHGSDTPIHARRPPAWYGQTTGPVSAFVPRRSRARAVGLS